MVPFLLAGGLYRPPAGIFTTGGFHSTRQHSEAENSLKLIQVTNISACMHGQQQQVKFKLKYQHKQHLRKVYFTQTTCMMTNVSKHS
jgi:hypothetical protein